jgi:hypothetical protein
MSAADDDAPAWLQQLQETMDELSHTEQGYLLLKHIEKLPAWLDRVEANTKTGAEKEHVHMARRRFAKMRIEVSRQLDEMHEDDDRSLS